MPSFITLLQILLHVGAALALLIFLLLTGGAGSGFWDGAFFLYLPVSVLLSVVLSAFAMGKGYGWLFPALLNAGMFFAIALMLAALSARGQLGSYIILVLLWLLVFAAGVFLVSSASALAVRGVILAVNGRRLQGLFMECGVICLLLLIYLSMASMSRWAYTPLNESVYFTSIRGESRFTTQYDSQNRPLLCDENGQPYTGIARSYSSKLKISPFTAQVSGLVYFKDGCAMGWSHSPEESDSRLLSAYPMTAPSSALYEQAGITMPVHKDYLSVLEAELQSWGGYLYIPGRTPEDTDAALYLDGDQKIHLAEITLHPNGLISEIRPYIAGGYDEWNSGGGYFLRFDPLGYPVTRQLWFENGTVDYEGQVTVPWNEEDFQICEIPVNPAKESAAQDETLETLLLHPRIPDLLQSSELWDSGLSNYDNLYLLHGGRADFSEVTSIGLLVWKDGRGTWTYLDRDQGAKAAEVLNRAALTTTARNHTETGYDGQSFEFEIGIGSDKSYRLLLKNDHFYLEDGFYTFSLNPYDLSSEDQRYYLNAAKAEFYDLLHEIIGEVIEEFEYVDTFRKE